MKPEDTAGTATLAFQGAQKRLEPEKKQQVVLHTGTASERDRLGRRHSLHAEHAIVQVLTSHLSDTF